MAVSAPTTKCRKCGADLSSRQGTGGFCARCLLGVAVPRKTTSSAPPSTIVLPASQKYSAAALQFTGKIGDYELVGEIARGGMGIVYRAQDTRVHRTVALKMILADNLGEISLKRFQSEASAAAALDHPNIVPIYEVGEANGQPFFTMKLIEGGNLATRMQTFHTHLRRGIALMAKVARAVHHAHQRGVLHRDLKPSNILINEADEPFITDFGLARRFDEDSNLTISGTFIGTPNFIAPELLTDRKKQLTTTSDIFSLGGILYNILTGKPPFHAENLYELLHDVQHKEPVRPAVLNPLVDLDLETICLKSLEKDARNRYRTALELAEDLERWLADETIVARRATPFERAVKWARRRPLVASLSAAVILAVIAGIIGISLQWREAEDARRIAEANRTAERIAKEDAQQQRATAETALHETAAMLTASELEKADSLFTEQNSPGGLAYLARVLRREPDNAVAAGRIMSFLRERHLALPEIITPKKECQVMAAALSPDGKCLITAVDQPEENLQLTYLDKPASISIHSATHAFEPLMSASNRMPNAAFGRAMMMPKLQVTTRAADGFQSGHISVARPRLPIIPGFFAVDFSPDGKSFVSSANSGTVRIWSTATGAAITPLLNLDAPVMNAAISSDGRSVVAIGRNGNVRAWDIASGKTLQNFHTSPPVASALFSPDAKQVIITHVSGFAQIWDIPSETDTGVIQHDDMAYHAAWSRDAQAAAIATSTEVYVWHAANISAGSRRLKHALPVATMALTSDGSKLISGSDDKFARIWDIHTGKLLVPPLEHAEAVRYVVFSPDDKKIATISQGNAIRVWETATGKPVCEPLQLRSPGVFAQFTPDGKALVVLGSDGTISRHTFMIPPSPVIDLPDAGRILSANFSTDGQTLLTAAASGLAQTWDVRSGRKLSSIQHGSPLVSAALNGEGSRLISADEKRVKVWDTRTGQMLAETMPVMSQILSVQFHPDGQHVLVSAANGMGTAWNITNRLAAPSFMDLPLWRDAIWHAATDRILGILVAGRAAAVFDRKRGKIIGDLLKHSDTVTSCRFSRDGSRVITSCIDNAAYVWDASTSRLLTSPLRHDGMVYYAAFAPDNQQVVTASRDKTARLWRIGTEASLTHTLVHDAGVRYAEFSQDGKRLLTVADDFTVHLWDARLGRRLADPFSFQTNIVSAHFSPDGQTIFIASEDEVARLWSIPTMPLPAPDWLADLAELIGGSRIDAKGLIQPVLRQDIKQLQATLASRTDPYAREVKRVLFPATK